MKPIKISDRAQAVLTLKKILQGRSLSEALETGGFVQELCYGTLRWYFRLDKLANLLISKPLKLKDNDIYLLLLIGLYQLIYTDIAVHAAVSETVNVAHELKKSWAAKLINAVLREYLRNSNILLSKLDTDQIAKFSHPDWLIKSIKKSWPNHWQDILLANNQKPPFSLRVNLQRQKREYYLPGKLHQYSESGITLEQAVNIKDLPGFHDGYVSVQDGAAQLAAKLLQLKPDQIILDACAAPGGKTAHILETEPNIKKLIALDIDKKRSVRVQENLIRLHLAHAMKEILGSALLRSLHENDGRSEGNKVQLIAGDAARPKTWWDGELFDRILLDAPCSATGVIRRHPDIKLLRRPEDISALSKQQLNILNSLWPLLKPGGLLLYATCSIYPAENTEIISAFLNTHPDAKENIIHAEWGITQQHGRQILPGMNDNMDGFYYACLTKQS